MSRQTFTWSPDLGAGQKRKPAVKPTRFGDGYEVRTPIGINSSPRVWSVRFTRNAAEAEAILNFLEARNATEAFDWTDPRNRPGVFVCRAWDSSQKQLGIYEVTADFEEVFEA